MNSTTSKREILHRWPKVQEELEELGLEVEFTPRNSFYIYEEAQYRHLYWRPFPKSRSKGKEFRLYHVYTPAVKYVFCAFYHPWYSLQFGGVQFIKSTNKESRKSVLQYAAPNGGCTGTMPIQYGKNSIGGIINAFWSSGFNGDVGLGGFFYNMYCLNETPSTGVDGRPSIPSVDYPLMSCELFEKWEALSPEDVMKCATHFDKPEYLLLGHNKETVNDNV